MEEQVPRVVIGMDPHKRSVTIEVMLADESVVGGGRFDTTAEGCQAMLAFVVAWPDRVWAIEGCEGIGGHIAHRLLADGQDVVDVPAKLSAVGVRSAQIDALVAVAIDDICHQTNPRPCTREDFARIFAEAI